jgi:predicted RNase H-like nuclease (RuvC/YqgF family)
MQPLSENLAELSAQAKKTEDRVAKAQTETKERLEQQREEAHREAQAALEKVDERISRASERTKSQFTQLKSKVDGDFERIRDNASARKSTFEAWQANNYADDKLADAQAAIGYAIVSVKLAELATLDAIEARGRAEIKSDQVQPIQA